MTRVDEPLDGFAPASIASADWRGMQKQASAPGRREWGAIVRWSLLCVLALQLVGCATNEMRTPIDPATPRLALAPVRLAPQATLSGRVDTAAIQEALLHVGHYLADELQALGLEVVTARDVSQLLEELANQGGYHSDASRLTRAAVSRLEVNSLLLVELIQWSPRDAVAHPEAGAAVGFRATLHGGPEGRLIWTGDFQERQLPFMRNPWRIVQYPGRGTRWLGVKELARWGAQQMSREIADVASQPASH